MNVFLDALSDAWSQMTGTLAYVAQAFGENWRTGLAALLERPPALFHVVGVVAVLALVLSGLTAENRVGYRRGRFLSANEKIFLRTPRVGIFDQGRPEPTLPKRGRRPAGIRNCIEQRTLAVPRYPDHEGIALRQNSEP